MRLIKCDRCENTADTINKANTFDWCKVTMETQNNVLEGIFELCPKCSIAIKRELEQKLPVVRKEVV